MRINVTRADIGLGLQHESSVCGIAVAMRRQHPDWQRVRVTEHEIAYTDAMTGERIHYETPERAAKFVREFDTDKNQVAPFSFDLPVTPVKVRPPVKPLPVAKLIEMSVKAKEQARKGRSGTPRPYNSTRRG